MSSGRATNRWALLGVMALAWGVMFLGGGPAWAKDPLFQAMGVFHDERQIPAPEFSLATPEGKTIALAQLRGKVVLLNF